MTTIQQKMQIRGQHIAPVYLNRTIPRLQILCGSRAKPEMAIEVLKLTNVKHEDIIGKKRVGRTAIVTGNYESKLFPSTGKTRILVGETLMAQGAVDITQREYLYSGDKEPVIQIRAGTAGGNNSEYLVQPVMGLGDIVISQSNIGSSGAIEQALEYFRNIVLRSFLNGENPFRTGKALTEQQRLELADHIDGMRNFAASWQALGGTFTDDGKFMIIPNSQPVIAALEYSAEKLGFSYYSANTFSKESLYGEDSSGVMFQLREKYRVLASEMEQLQNAFIAAYTKLKYNVNALTGMIVETIGAVPGPGFPDRNDKKQMKLQEKVEGDTMVIAAEALVYLAKIKPPE